MKDARHFLYKALVPLALTLSSLSACSAIGAESGGVRTLLIMAYNVKSLFDDVDDGSEYLDFSIAKGQWDTPRYRRRLEKLAEVILAAGPETKGPDIVCLEEIENEKVLNALREGPLASAGYRYAAISPAPGQAIASALLSKFPVKELKCHNAGALREAGNRAKSQKAQAEGRYILEAEFDIEGRSLHGFICHWKSKLGGAAATEEARREASSLVAHRVSALLASDAAMEIFVCGDFNENPDEYRRVNARYLTALLPAVSYEKLNSGALLLVTDNPDDAGPLPCPSDPVGTAPALYSPWLTSGGCSYIHEGKEERIDGFLLSPGLLDEEFLSFVSFAPFDADFLLDAEGRPREWSNGTPDGYSDHLPVLLRLAVGEKVDR